ncbi:MAG: HD domain-containing protein [Gammaproteobacteria bacterium]|nr:HD domain-containing protein [Gammaproteobacteria bacterium]
MTESKSVLRPSLHYIAAFLLLGIYGTQVCPFIESLSPLQLTLPLLTIIILQYALRQIAVPSMVDRCDYKHQVTRSFKVEWLLFILSGLLLSLNNSIFFSAPLDSNLKMIVGFTSIGYFIATDLALDKEIKLAEFLKQQNMTIIPDSKYFPLAGKFTLFASASLIILVLVFFLLINKDLLWIGQANKSFSDTQARLIILGEFAFVGATLLSYIINVIFSYARNMKFFLESENEVLAKATAGDLNNSITVSTNDEFGEIAHHTNLMIKSLLNKTRELQKTQDVTIISLASLAETRDNETGAHILRTQRYVKAIARAVQHHPRFSNQLNDEIIELLYKSAPLHDIGKVGIPDRILLKPEKLDNDEFEIMKTHATLGNEALKQAEEELGGTSFLSYAREIALTHHEKWDGSGYPEGLKGDEIPLSGRLMAIADVYDALISKRVYKPAFTHEEAMKIIKQGKGSHFDPDLIEAMLNIEDKFISIAKQYADKEIYDTD